MPNFVNVYDKNTDTQNRIMAKLFASEVLLEIASQEAKIQDRIQRHWEYLQTEITKFLAEKAKEHLLSLDSALGFDSKKKDFSVPGASKSFRDGLIKLFVEHIKRPPKPFMQLNSSEQLEFLGKIDLLHAEDERARELTRRKAGENMVDVFKRLGYLPEGFTDKYLANDLDIDKALADKRGSHPSRGKNKRILFTLSLCPEPESGKQTEDEICEDLKTRILENKPKPGELKDGDTRELYFPINNGQTHFIFLKVVMDAANNIQIIMEDSKSPTPGTENAFKYAKKAAELAGYSPDKIKGLLTYTKQQLDGTRCPYFAVRKIMQEVDKTDALAQEDVNRVKLAFVKKVIQSETKQEDKQLAAKLDLDHNGIIIRSDMSQLQKQSYDAYKAKEEEHAASLKQLEELRTSLTSKNLSSTEPLFKIPDEKTRVLSKAAVEHNEQVLNVMVEEQIRISSNITVPTDRQSYAEMACEVCQMANQIDTYRKTLKNAVSEVQLIDHKENIRDLQKSLIDTSLVAIVKQSSNVVETVRQEALIKLVGTTKINKEQADALAQNAMSVVPGDAEKRENFKSLVRDTLLSKVSVPKPEIKLEFKQSPEAIEQERRDRLFAQALQDQELINYFKCVSAAPDKKKELEEQAKLDEAYARQLQAELDKEGRVSPGFGPKFI